MNQIPHPGVQCWNCGESLQALPQPISRHEHCPRCFEAVHCCRMCRHYQPDAAIGCAEDRADPPVNHDNANFCDWFKPRPRAFSEHRGTRSKVARSQLESLFGAAADEPDPDAVPTQPAATDSAESQADAARSRLDSLFSKD